MTPRGVQPSAPDLEWEILLRTHSSRIVEELYQGILGRSADASGMEIYSKRIGKSHNIQQSIQSLISSEEFRRRFSRNEMALLKSSAPLVNPAKKEVLVFIHLHKTAGTSLQRMLIESFGREKVYHEHDDTLYLRRPCELNSYDVIAGHFNHDSLAYIPAGRKRLFAMVREPMERLVSLYTFLRAHEPSAPAWHQAMEDANRLGIADFFSEEKRRTGGGYWNHMTWGIMGGTLWMEWRAVLKDASGVEREKILESLKAPIRQRLNEFFFVGIQGYFEQSCEILFRLLKREMPPSNNDHSVEKIANKVNYFKKVKKPEVTLETSNILSGLIELDRIVYSEALDIFGKNISHTYHIDED